MQSSNYQDLQTNEQICMEKKKLKRSLLNEWVQSLSWGKSQRRKWKPIPVSSPGKSHRQRSLAGYSPWGHKESDTT